MSSLSEQVYHNCGFCVTHTLHDAYSFIDSLQHRGREATGIAAVGDGIIDVVKWKGNVKTVDLEDLHKILPSSSYHSYLGHVRYATRGRKDQVLEDAHPHVIGGDIENRMNHIIIRDCDMAIVHNGQVDRKYFEGIDQSLLKTGCDTEALLHLFKEKGEGSILRDIPGAFTMAVADKRRKDVIVLRDRTGIKPGVLGIKDGKYVVTSEDIAIRENGGEHVEDLQPGCAYYLGSNGSYEKKKFVEPKKSLCFFELNYIANADSVIDGTSVRAIREALGERLGEELGPIDVDLVTYLPRCPEPAARSLARKIGKPFVPVFYKLRGERSFQGSTPADRKSSIEQNLYMLPSAKKKVSGMKVAVTDDSTVRGNNAQRVKDLLEEAGVQKIYHLNYTPPIGIVGNDGVERGCMFGVDMPPDDSFIARNRTLEEISQKVGMSVLYITYEGMLQTFEKFGKSRNELCTYCIGGKYPFK